DGRALLGIWQVGLECRQIQMRAECRSGHRHGDLAEQLIALALEHRVARHVDLEIEVAGRTASGTHLALAGQLDARALVDTRWDRDRDRTARAYPALTGALGARIGDHGAEAVACGAGPRRADVA